MLEALFIVIALALLVQYVLLLAMVLLLLSVHVLLLAARPRADPVLALLGNRLGMEIPLLRVLTMAYEHVYLLGLLLVVVFGLVLWRLVGCRVRVVVRALPLP